MTANQIRFLEAQETKRSNLAKEMETHRTNVSNETIKDIGNLIQMEINRSEIEYKSNKQAVDWINAVSNLIGNAAKSVGGIASIIGAL